MRATLAVLLTLICSSTYSQSRLVTLPSFPGHEQPDGFTCGPTCAKSVLNYYGIDVSVEELRNKCDTDVIRNPSNGEVVFGYTTPDEISDAISSYGIPSQWGKRVTINELKRFVDQRRPPIILIRSDINYWHYVVVTGYDTPEETIELMDPGNGEKLYIRENSLDAVWSWDAGLDISHNGTNYVAKAVSIEGAKCQVCKASGKWGWTKCATCDGSGWWSAGVLGKTKCPTCYGEGRYSSKCQICGGDGRMTDWSRKVIEQAGWSGHSAVVPKNAAPHGGMNQADLTNKRIRQQVSHFSVVSLINKTPIDINFIYHWGDGQWQRGLVASGQSTFFSTPAHNMQPEIAFDHTVDQTTVEYRTKLPAYNVTLPQGDLPGAVHGMPYVFQIRGNNFILEKQ